MAKKICRGCETEFETKTAKKTCGNSMCQSLLEQGRRLRHWEKYNTFPGYTPPSRIAKCKFCGDEFYRKRLNKLICNKPECKKLRLREYESKRKSSTRKEYCRKYYREYYHREIKNK